MIDLTRTNEEKSDGDTWNINGCGKTHINWEFPRNQPCFLGFVPLTAIAIDYLYWLSQKYRLTKCGMTWIHAPWHLAAQLSNVERSTLANPTMNHPSIQVKQPQWGPFQIIQNNMCITGIAYSWIYLTRTMPGISTTSNSIHDSLLKDRDGFHGGDSETAMYTSENLRNLPARNGSEWWFQRKSHVNKW